MAQSINTIKWVHAYLAAHIKSGDTCIDATAGRGHDTALLSALVGETGHVLAFDIQQQALESTAKLLQEKNLQQSVTLYLDSHTNMQKYVAQNAINAIVFNLGYLPGGDHAAATTGETTILAIRNGLALLVPKGMMTICIYHGGDSGFAERDRVLAYLRTLDHQHYTVMVTDFYNRPNNPPLAVVIIKE